MFWANTFAIQLEATKSLCVCCWCVLSSLFRDGSVNLTAFKVRSFTGVLFLPKIHEISLSLSPSKCRTNFETKFLFLKKSYNINHMSLGNCMQISKTLKLGVHKSDFSQNIKICAAI